LGGAARVGCCHALASIEEIGTIGNAVRHVEGSVAAVLVAGLWAAACIRRWCTRTLGEKVLARRLARGWAKGAIAVICITGLRVTAYCQGRHAWAAREEVFTSRIASGDIVCSGAVVHAARLRGWARADSRGAGATRQCASRCTGRGARSSVVGTRAGGSTA
jgi:hypothetical protein